MQANDFNNEESDGSTSTYNSDSAISKIKEVDYDKLILEEKKKIEKTEIDIIETNETLENCRKCLDTLKDEGYKQIIENYEENVLSLKNMNSDLQKLIVDLKNDNFRQASLIKKQAKEIENLKNSNSNLQGQPNNGQQKTVYHNHVFNLNSHSSKKGALNSSNIPSSSPVSIEYTNLHNNADEVDEKSNGLT